MRITPAVRNLVIANVAISFLLLVLLRVDRGLGETIELYLSLSPSLVVHKGWVWQLVTYLFVHVAPMHLFFNMLFLWMLGPMFERMWGPRSFLRFLVLSGLGAGLAVVLTGFVFPNWDMPTQGISGSLNALVMAFALTFPEQEVYFWGIAPVKGKYFVLIAVLFDVFFVLSGWNVSLPAHLGGLATGYLLITGYWRPGRLLRRFRRSLPPTRGGGRGHLRIVPGDHDRDRDDDRPPKRYLN